MNRRRRDDTYLSYLPTSRSYEHTVGVFLLLDPLLDKLVRAKVRDRFGGRLKAAMSGGARLEWDAACSISPSA
jgi:long-subunit acyl-CoA synthetase (AMP-forming)